MTDTNENCQLNIICYTPWKNSKIRTSVIPSNSRPIPQPRKWHAPARPMPSCNDGLCEDNNIPLGVPSINHQDYVSGAGFISRRSIQNASKNAQGVWYRAAPNPIKHWRKQLFPRQGDLPGAYWNVPSERVSILHVMERPGGAVTLDIKDQGTLWQSCNGTLPENTLTIPLYLNDDVDKSSCEILNESIIGSCNKSITRQNTIFAKDYHSSSKTYLQSRAKLYRQKEAIQFSRRKNKISPASKPNMYESLYQTDQSGCFVLQDCSCIVQVAYKPRNIVFTQNSAVSSSVYTKYVKNKTTSQNQYNVTNKWGLDGVNTFKLYPLIWPAHPGYRMPAGGIGSKTFCCHNSGNQNNELYFTSDWSLMFKDGVINPDAAMYKFFVDRGLENDPLTQDLIDILTPYSKQATNMQETFLDASGFNLDISGWNVDNVTNMSSMFKGATIFNQDIGDWDTGNVTNMSSMFNGANAFNQNLYTWNTSKVTNIYRMFYNTKFNQPINTQSVTVNGNTYIAWDVSKVTNMSGTFWCEFFDQEIGNWDTSNVTDMSSMFSQNDYFNKSINTSTVTVGGNTYTAWDVSKVTNMSEMFASTFFDQEIGNWNTSEVINMEAMFSGAQQFNKNISKWNTSKVTNMAYMFEYTQFNKPINTQSVTVGGNTYTAWDTSQVTNMRRMFYATDFFNQDIGNWNTSKVTNMEYMFYATDFFNQDIGSWDTVKVTNMSNMFNGATAFNQDLGNWNVNNVTDFTNMFTGTAMATTYNINSSRTVAGWVDTKGGGTSVAPNDASIFGSVTGWSDNGLFEYSYVFFDNAEFKTAGADAPGSATYGTADNWCVSKLTDMSHGFDNNTTFNENINNWDVANVTNMSSMFRGAVAFNQDLNNWDVSSVTNMSYMFRVAVAFNGDITTWTVNNVTNMSEMFLTALLFNQDLSTWQIEKVTNMNSMFKQAMIFDQNLSAWVVWFADPKPTIVEMFVAATVFNNGTSGSINSQAMRGAWSTSLGGPYSAGELDAAYIYPF